MKAMEKLVAFYESKKGKVHGSWHKTLGNHSVKIYPGGSADFIYHWTAICKVDAEGNVVIRTGGWNTVSTNRACSSYAYEFSSRGYNVEDTRPMKR